MDSATKKFLYSEDFLVLGEFPLGKLSDYYHKLMETMEMVS